MVDHFNAEMAVMAEQAGKLLDFGQKLDIQLLDNVVSSMYTAEGEQVSHMEFLPLCMLVCVHMHMLVCVFTRLCMRMHIHVCV